MAWVGHPCTRARPAALFVRGWSAPAGRLGSGYWSADWSEPRRRVADTQMHSALPPASPPTTALTPNLCATHQSRRKPEGSMDPRLRGGYRGFKDGVSAGTCRCRLCRLVQRTLTLDAALGRRRHPVDQTLTPSVVLNRRRRFQPPPPPPPTNPCHTTMIASFEYIPDVQPFLHPRASTAHPRPTASSSSSTSTPSRRRTHGAPR